MHVSVRPVKVSFSFSWLRAVIYTVSSKDWTKQGGFVDYEIDNTIDWGNGTEQIIPGYNDTQVISCSDASLNCGFVLLWLFSMMIMITAAFNVHKTVQLTF